MDARTNYQKHPPDASPAPVPLYTTRDTRHRMWTGAIIRRLENRNSIETSGGGRVPHLNLSVDDALSTTRAVRRRLDLARPVEPEVIAECVALAQQAPSGGNFENMAFIAIADPAQRLALAEVYRRAYEAFTPHAGWTRAPYAARMGASVEYLYQHLHEVPVLIVPCHTLPRPRSEQIPFNWANLFADAHMATWSFMLAARERGLGTSMTTVHLLREEEAAGVLGLDYDGFIQTALIPVAYTRGTDFKPAARKPANEVLHWDRW
jgi:nitroreductase